MRRGFVTVDTLGVSSGPAVDSAFLAALTAVPPVAWSVWVGEYPASADPALPYVLTATFAIPPCRGVAAICLLETIPGNGLPTLEQAALRLWSGLAPVDARVLHQQVSADGSVVSTLATAWADPVACRWLSEAMSAGASLRADGWEWLSTPERPALSKVTSGSARHISGRHHDVVLFEPSAVAVVYGQLTRGGQPELDLLRHLERVPGVRVAPILLGSAIIRGPDGQRSACALLEDIVPGAATVRSVIVGRLKRALDGDPSLQASALDDVRAVGVITRELHAALGRPFEQGVLDGAVPATVADVESWVARVWTTLTSAIAAHKAARQAETDPERALGNALDVLPGKLQQFAAAAEAAPGLVHRIHGNLRLDTILMAPPRKLSVVEFDGDALLPDQERVAPQSPWRDVARVLVSIAQVAAEAAHVAGGDEKAFEIAWLWEREARKACLEGYGTGGGALHALLAMFEMEFTARLLLDALATGGSTDVASHTLQRLTRTIV